MLNNFSINNILSIINAKIKSFISNIKYSPCNENYFEQINSSINSKSKYNHPILLNSNLSFKNFYQRNIKKIDNSNIHSSIISKEKIVNLPNFLKKKTNRNNSKIIDDSELIINNKNSKRNNLNIPHKFRINNEFPDYKDSFSENLKNNNTLNKINNSSILNNKYKKIDIKEDYNFEKDYKIKEYKEIFNDKNIPRKVDNEKDFNNDLTNFNIENDKKDSNNKNAIIDLKEKEMNINESFLSLKNSFIKSFDNSIIFKGELLPTLNESFSYYLNNSAKRKINNNFQLQKQNQFSYRAQKIDNKEDKSGINNNDINANIKETIKNIISLIMIKVISILNKEEK